jgi:hypothetical protein
VAPPPADDELLTMDYFAAIDHLSVEIRRTGCSKSTPTHISTDAVLRRSLLDNATRAAQWKGLLDEVMGRIIKNAKRNRFGAGPLVPNTLPGLRHRGAEGPPFGEN